MKETVVQRQLQAYNDKNIDAFMDCYSEDIKIYDFPDTLRMEGQEAMRTRYQTLFESYPDMIATVDKRIFHGNYAIDHEEITGRLEGSTLKAVAIYEIKDDRITKVWFLKGNS
ncbi:nuclear transport factor 2 family protein [Paenibacillus planticolens]|uniref:Steroid delta-isomerase n=1 Tax=Paenibacillus planticolens TaxID=2654976 RepID=A0ABX1ZNV3_9BACL|nr:nuclear transport factor 2 family protein [Paenibacillus planticolens]NOV01496.1 steroid delta-isomerase [Paenibacillus planticolens]